jgi:hypothetical protein
MQKATRAWIFLGGVVVLLLVYATVHQPESAPSGRGTASVSDDCRYAGSWASPNGDTLVLGRINSQTHEGTTEYRSGFMPSFGIRGGYRLESGDRLHIRGKDDYGTVRDVTMLILSENPPSSFTTGPTKPGSASV